MRNISFALTTEQFLHGTKTVTRRLGWEKLQAGEIICAVEKGQGLKKGETVKKLGVITVKDVRRERLDLITAADCALEGFPDMAPSEFIDMFCKHNRCARGSLITRIEFERKA